MQSIERVVSDPKELRVPKAPGDLHDRIEKYMAIVRVTQGRTILKPEAIVELLTEATKHITLP